MARAEWPGGEARGSPRIMKAKPPRRILAVDEYGQHEDRTPTHGYEATREAAMAAFAKSWRRGG